LGVYFCLDIELSLKQTVNVTTGTFVFVIATIVNLIEGVGIYFCQIFISWMHMNITKGKSLF